MEKTTIDLINGTFNSEEGKDIILNLLNNKIHFHTVRSLGYWENAGQKDTVSLNRLKDLKSTRDQVINLMNDPNLQSKKISIRSIIEIQIDQ